MESFEILGPCITLGQLLKAAGFVGAGGEIKEYLKGNLVMVNGESESRRGRKLYPGDSVQVGDGPIISLISQS